MNISLGSEEYIEAALETAKLAYAPYSGYRVGCVVVTTEDEIYRGANIENGSYGLTCCAERVALYHAMMHGKGPGDIKAVVIASTDDSFPSPCGACRQVLAELAPQARVVTSNGKAVKVATVSELLPAVFSLRPGDHNSPITNH
ncbi:MAG: Cytidine deaminase [Chloroflexi bacterium]|nr:Cytidine deaminase [Chloroflexota bacterium]MBT9165554.1 Cytidine deaminase [Chloroflexota bacterium]